MPFVPVVETRQAPARVFTQPSNYVTDLVLKAPPMTPCKAPRPRDVAAGYPVTNGSYPWPVGMTLSQKTAGVSGGLASEYVGHAANEREDEFTGTMQAPVAPRAEGQRRGSSG